MLIYFFQKTNHGFQISVKYTVLLKFFIYISTLKLMALYYNYLLSCQSSSLDDEFIHLEGPFLYLEGPFLYLDLDFFDS